MAKVYKDERGNWAAESAYIVSPLIVLRVRTYKIHSGHIVTHASGWQRSKDGGTAGTHQFGRDFGRDIFRSDGKARCTEKTVLAAHAHNPIELLAAARAHYNIQTPEPKGTPLSDLVGAF